MFNFDNAKGSKTSKDGYKLARAARMGVGTRPGSGPAFKSQRILGASETHTDPAETLRDPFARIRSRFNLTVPAAQHNGAYGSNENASKRQKTNVSLRTPDEGSRAKAVPQSAPVQDET